MSLTLSEKKAIAGVGAFLVGALLVKRALAKTPPKGEVYIDRVTVTPTTWKETDNADLVLATLQRQAMEELGVDLDEMAPTKIPSPMQTLTIEGTIAKLRAAGKADEANFLSTLLHEAQALPGFEA